MNIKEEVLHYLWKTKRLPFHKFRLTDGRNLEVIQTGTHNMDGGPDFSNAKIKIDDLIWSGNIEIHVKASEWFKHKHHVDNAYDTVILHVVYQEDRRVELQNEKIPTLQLQDYISQKEIFDIQQIITSKQKIPCHNQIQYVDNLYVTKQIETVLFQRLKRKAELIQYRYLELGNDLKQVMIEWIAQTIAGKTNALPMIELSKQVKYSNLIRESEDNRLNMLLYLSGLLPSDLDINQTRMAKHVGNKYHVKPMNASAWKFFGLYAYSYPPFRILQFSYLIGQDKFFHFLNSDITAWLNWWMDWQFQLPDYWANHTSFSGKEIKHSQSFSKQVKELIVINVVVPFLFWHGMYNQQDNKIELAFSLLANLPPERNNIISTWQKMQINVKSAFESQGLLELINEFCRNKKCLVCHIGNKVLQHENDTKDCSVF